MLRRVEGWTRKGRADALSLVLWLAIACFLVLHVGSLLRGWDNTLLDAHSFRQCQTALTARMFLTEGFKVTYETPVFGPPWSIPFEAPIYQGVVAVLARLFDTPLEQTGRAVSALFFYASFGPVLLILRSLGVNRMSRIYAILFLLSSPLYIFWSRTFLIESTALFFSLVYAALVLRLGDGDRRKWIVIAAVLVGALAALTKITTFAVCLGFSILYVGWRFWHRRDGIARISALMLVIWLLPIAVGVGWNAYADHIKAMSPTPMARAILSSNLSTFNFGALEQRFSPAYWKAMVAHGVDNVTGGYTPLLFALAAWLLISSRRIQSFLLFAAFCSGPLVFANLYAVHDYYWYANAVFLLLALAVSLGEAGESGVASKLGATALVLFACASQWWGYWHSSYFDQQGRNETYLRDLGDAVREKVAPKDVFMAIGFDWSSALPYYAQRRAILTWRPGFESDPGTIAAVRALKQENRELSLLAVTGTARQDDELLRKMRALYGFDEIPAFDDGRTVIFTARSHRLPPAMPILLGLPCVGQQLAIPTVELREDGRKVWRLHAPSRVELALPPGAKSFAVWYGLARLAYTNAGQTDGVSFKISLIRPDGHSEVLLEKVLDPLRKDADQGLRRAEFIVSPSVNSRLILETNTNGTNLWDWAVWSDVETQ